jgi:hypothetical protein
MRPTSSSFQSFAYLLLLGVSALFLHNSRSSPARRLSKSLFQPDSNVEVFVSRIQKEDWTNTLHFRIHGVNLVRNGLEPDDGVSATVSIPTRLYGILRRQLVLNEALGGGNQIEHLYWPGSPFKEARNVDQSIVKSYKRKVVHQDFPWSHTFSIEYFKIAPCVSAKGHFSHDFNPLFVSWCIGVHVGVMA